MMGSLAITAQTLQKQLLLQGARKISAPRPELRSLRATAHPPAVPDLRTLGGELLLTSYTASSPANPPPPRRRPKEAAFWGTSPESDLPGCPGCSGPV